MHNELDEDGEELRWVVYMTHGDRNIRQIDVERWKDITRDKYMIER